MKKRAVKKTSEDPFAVFRGDTLIGTWPTKALADQSAGHLVGARVVRLVPEKRLKLRAKKKNPAPRTPTEKAAVKEYKRVHWGRAGKEKIDKGRCADPRELSVALGPIVSIVYLTEKGKPELVEWEHHFSKKSPPMLAFTKDGLLIIGGGYTVNERGIVG